MSATVMIAQGEPVLAWHFGSADGRLGHGDGRPIVFGETLRHGGPLVLCESGLHASESIVEALRYAQSWRLYRVRCSGVVLRGAGVDKVVCSERTAFWEVDARRPVHQWAADCAERALRREREAGREPDPRSWVAVEMVRAHLRGESVDRSAAVHDARDASFDATKADAMRAINLTHAAAFHAAASVYIHPNDVHTAAHHAVYAAAAAAAANAARAARAARVAERRWQHRRLIALVSRARRAA